MRASKHHRELDEMGYGKCSVPMWQRGLPAGFCDEDAFSEPTKNGRILYTGYVPGLACPGHGGEQSRVFKDGNQWCAVMPDFINLQESPAGFGNTQLEARSDLHNSILIARKENRHHKKAGA